MLPGFLDFWRGLGLKKVVVAAVMAAAGVIGAAYGTKVAAAVTPIAGLEGLSAWFAIGAGLGLFGFAYGQSQIRKHLGDHRHGDRARTRSRRHVLRRLGFVSVLLGLALITIGVVLDHQQGFQLVATAGSVGLSLLDLHATLSLAKDSPTAEVGASHEGESGSGGDGSGCEPVEGFVRAVKHWSPSDRVEVWIRFLLKPQTVAILIAMALVVSVSVQGIATAARLWVSQNAQASGEVSETGSEDASSATHQVKGVDSNKEVPPACAEITPGSGAPRLLARGLRKAWESLGPLVGCATLARPTGDDRAYVIHGTCAGSRWSLAVASPRYPAEVALEPATRPAEEVAVKWGLVGLSRRADRGGGDFQLVRTPVGPFLLIREHKTDGNGGLLSPPNDCTEIEPAKETYTVLTPGAAELLVRFSLEVARVWPEPDASWGDGEEHFALDSPSGQTMARVVCSEPVECRLTSPSVVLESSPLGVKEWVNVDSIKSG